MKVYKEEWIPGNHKTENVEINLQRLSLYHVFLGLIFYFHYRKIEPGSLPVIN